MSKLGFALSILVLPFALLSIQAQPAETKTVAATISGLVTLKGEPARGVTVTLQPQRSDPSNALRAGTDEQGNSDSLASPPEVIRSSRSRRAISRPEMAVWEGAVGRSMSPRARKSKISKSKSNAAA